MLGPGEVWEDDLYGNGIITTDKPTLLIQILIRINGATVDPSLIQVPSESQFTQFGIHYSHTFGRKYQWIHQLCKYHCGIE